jgi:hypothetical protein
MPDIEELMQLVVDGAATPQQVAELNAAIEKSADARERFESLQGLTRDLDSVPLVDPPGVKPAVMAAIRPIRRFRRDSRARHWFIAAYAAAVLLVVGVAVRHAVVPAPTSAGSMAPVDGPVVARAVSPSGTLTVRRDGDVYLVQVANATSYTIEFDNTRLEQIGPNTFRRRPSVRGTTVLRLLLPANNELKVTIGLD